ncbi:hypothetical protein U9M48_029874 [Paspalum notatum var. saurae]|uniref:Protein kinase domain-containing protein n=1 Tax=Paspalum notatum var. saurae TaxID=547442 RepID=A0AAQ3TZR1_PASNO
MTMVQGTLGYLDPEYLQEQKLTEKSDVYSFGVVLLELITGKTAIYYEGNKEGKNLAMSFQQALKNNRVQSMLDTGIICAGTEELFQEVGELASRCLSFKGEERPSMTQVADKLKAIRSSWSEMQLLKHEETQHLADERSSTDSDRDLSSSIYLTKRMLGVDMAPLHVDQYHTIEIMLDDRSRVSGLDSMDAKICGVGGGAGPMTSAAMHLVAAAMLLQALCLLKNTTVLRRCRRVYIRRYMASPLCSGARLLLLVLGAALILQQHTSTASVLLGAAAGNNSVALPNCPDKCPNGNVSIPYPFGIGQDCFLNQDFNVTCDQQNGRAFIRTGEQQYADSLGATNMFSEVLGFDLLNGEARIQNNIRWKCNYTNNTQTRGPHVLISLGDSLKVSYTKNKFTAIGCATVATIVGSRTPHMVQDEWHYTTTCASFCDSVGGISHSPECDGMGCCQASIPANLSAFRFNFVQDDAVLYNPFAQSFSPCSSVFVVETASFSFDPSYAQSNHFMTNHGDVPLVLDWRVSNETCEKTNKSSPSYACRARDSVCIDTTNGVGYRCNCSPGYEGNPYLVGGCQDINECDPPGRYPCNGICTNTNGSYLCTCPKGTSSEDPKTTLCSRPNQPKVKALICMFCAAPNPVDNNLFSGIFITFVFLVICISALLIWCQKRKLAKEKEKFFKQNGGHILYQQILSKQIDTVTIFKIEELKTATDNFDRSREIGTGGHGTVYKGILEGYREVAVKRSKTINVTETEEFVQEIIILSQINHKNVVRLLGCCLEVEVPILVYEFVPNGTLFQLIHDNHGIPSVSLEVRLRIAQETAEALAYLHLSINRPIVHGDVKSLNILLGEDYMAKVTDFGASRILPKDTVQLMTLVQGTLGYLDPEYLQERQLTNKSDVYSFGVVLLELITGKTAIYFEGSKEGKYLASSFQEAMKEKRVEGMLDTSIVGVGMEELFQEVAEVASLCLSSKGIDRPSMTQVADKLKAIRSTWRLILMLKHKEAECLAERLSTGSACDMSSSMYWTARMMGLDIETPQEDHADDAIT